MNIREHIEKNPFVYLIGIVVATVGISISADQYFSQKAANLLKAQHKLEVDQLHTRLASIDRRISGGDFLDIRSMAITRAGQREVPLNSEYNFELNAYVTKDKDFWVYEKMKREEFDLNTIDHGQMWEQVKDNIRKSDRYINSPLIHVWSRKDRTSIRSEKWGGSEPLSLILFPFVAIQKMSINDFLEKYKFSVTIPAEKEKDVEQDKTRHISLELLNKYYRGDVVGVLFVEAWEQLQKQNSILEQFRDSMDIQLELLTAQKIGNVLYCQSMTTFNDVLANDKPVRQYYIHVEFFIFLTSEHIFMIWANLPSHDPLPRGEYSSKITQWFSDLAILID